MIYYCGRGSMVELELPKLTTRVRFPSPAPAMLRRSFERRFLLHCATKYGDFTK